MNITNHNISPFSIAVASQTRRCASGTLVPRVGDVEFRRRSVIVPERETRQQRSAPRDAISP